MSVMVERAESYRTCGSCTSDKNVVNITISRRVGQSRQGTQIALCEDCARQLRDLLDTKYIRPRGRWIAGPGNTYTCSKCGFSMITNQDYIKRHYFCLNCGCQMEGVVYEQIAE